MHSFTQDLTCVTYLLLSETMHRLQVQRRREAFNIVGASCVSFARIPLSGSEELRILEP